MNPAKHIGLGWIWVWATVSIMCANLTTLGTWGSIWAIISGVIAFVSAAILIGRWCYHKRALRELATVDFGRSGGFMPNYMSYTSENSQSADITITIKADIDIERIRIGFRGGGNPPKIEHLYDWNYPNYEPSYRGLKEDLIHDWSWDYFQPQHRSKGSHVFIAIRYTANHSFNGTLEVGLTCSKSHKVFSLPFEVRDPSLIQSIPHTGEPSSQ